MENAKFNPMDLHELVGSSDMTLGEMITSFRQAKDRRLQLHALAELTLLKEEEIKDLLLTHGVSYKEMPRAPRKKAPVEVKPDPMPAPAKPARKSKASPPPPEKIQQTEAPPVQTSPLLDELRSMLIRRDDLAKELAKIDAQLDEMRRLLELKGENDGK